MSAVPNLARPIPAGPPAVRLLLVAGVGAAAAAGAALPWPLPVAAVAAIAGALAFAASVSSPALPVWLMLALLFFGNRNEFPSLYFWGRYMPTAALALFFAAVFGRQISAGRLYLRGKAFVGLVAAFLALLLLSTAYNGASLRNLVLSVVANLRYPLFYVALLTVAFPVSFYRRVMTAFVVLALLQVPVALVQFASGIKSDVLAGTLGTNGSLIAVVLVAQGALTAAWVVGRVRMRFALTGVLALLVPLLLGDVQAGWLFSPILVAWIIVRQHGTARIVAALRRLVPGVVGLSLALVIAPLVSSTVRQFYRALPDHAENLRRWSEPRYTFGSSVGRFTILLVSVPLQAANPVRLLLGYGPEAASGGLIGATTFTSAQSADVAIENQGIACQELARLGFQCRESQSYRAVTEFGLLGTAVYGLALLLVWRGAWRLRRSTGSPDSRLLVLLFDGVAFFYCGLAFWYMGVWRLDSFSFPFWLLAAAMDAERRRQRTASESDPGIPPGDAERAVRALTVSSIPGATAPASPGSVGLDPRSTCHRRAARRGLTEEPQT